MDDKLEIIREIKKNNFEGFKKLIDKFDDFDDFALIKRFGDSLYSKSDEDLESLPKSGIPLLHVAAYYNSLQCFQYLQKEKQIPLRHLSSQKLLPLHYALYAGSTDVSLYILQEDPEESILHPEENKCFSILFCAVCESNQTVVEELFKNGLKLNDPWNDEELIINRAIGRHDVDLFRLIWEQRSPIKNDEKNKPTYAMKCAINHDVNILQIVYDKDYDLDKYFVDRSGYNSLISLIAGTDVRHIFKALLLKILDDVIEKSISIEPPEEFGESAGVCHWCCEYNDLDVAKKMLKTKNVKINRFDKYKKTGAFRLIEHRGQDVPAMLELLIKEGFDVNVRYDENHPSLLEGFAHALAKNYPAIELLIRYGADINATHSRQTNKQGDKMTLLQFVKEKGDPKIKKIFEEAEK